jgi:trehalose 6-phosphate phosphatase
MKNVLGPIGTERLTSLMAERPLAGFDFDGTLVALCEHPADVQITPGTRDLLTRLCDQMPVVVISGRARDDVVERLAGIPLVGIAGNHGIEPFGESPEIEVLVAEWHEALRRDLARCPGVFIEDKRYSLTVDYRHAPDLEATRDAINTAAKRLPRARLLGGRHADFNITPEGAPHKGTALMEFLRITGRSSALYVGDDRTDEDAFRLDLPGLMAVRVGKRENSGAPYFLESQPEIDQLIGLLLDRQSPAAPTDKA